MKKINRSKFKLGIALALVAIALNHQSLAVAADEIVAQNTEIASSPTVPPVKFDVEYMDDGVRVIIPKMLPETKVKADENLLYPRQGKNGVAIALDDSVAASYSSSGYKVLPNLVWYRGTLYNQTLAFVGNTQGLDKLNQGYEHLSTVNSIYTGFRKLAGVVVSGVIGGALGGTELGLQAGANSLSGNDGNVNIKNAKSAVFDGYQSIAAKDTDKIEIYGVSTQGDKYQGNIVFITEKAEVDDAVVIRGIIKAQNITKLSE